MDRSFNPSLRGDLHYYYHYHYYHYLYQSNQRLIILGMKFTSRHVSTYPFEFQQQQQQLEKPSEIIELMCLHCTGYSRAGKVE